MNESQILTVAIAVIIPSVAVLYSNSRITDLSKRIDDTNTNLARHMDNVEKRLIEHIDNAFSHMELLLKLHEAQHHK